MRGHSSERVLVHLRALSTSKPVLGKFTDCVVSVLSAQRETCEEKKAKSQCLELQVNYELIDNKFILSLPKDESDEKAPILRHPSFCPVLALSPAACSNLPLHTLSRGINLGVVALLESADQHILITRRAAHMRTFPGVWVPPGGGINLGESLIQCGIRELAEETGIQLDADSTPWHVLCFWESVYHPRLELGQPERHHIVVYLHLLVNKPYSHLQTSIKLQQEETDACAWLSPDLARLTVTRLLDKSELNFKKTFSAIGIDCNGEQCQVEIPLEVLYARCEHRVKRVIERVSTGTRFAISQWLKKIF